MSEAQLAAWKGKAYTVLAIVFVAGLATGILGLRAYTRYAVQQAAQPVHEQTVVAVDKLNKELGLTPDQIKKLTVILDDHIMMEADLLAKMRALQQEGRTEIVKVLTPEQRAKFESMVHPVSGP